MLLNINTRAAEEHAIRLSMIGRSAIPVAVRQTLNKAAFDVKTNTMPKASGVFVHRNPTFFIANSRVEQAKGLEVAAMRATIGFKPKAGDKSHSVEDLEEQEYGGDIKGRAFVALAKARVSGNWNKNVRKPNRLETIRTTIVDPKKNSKDGKEGFIRSALHAGVGGFILNQSHSRVEQIKAIKREKGRTIVKVDIVDSVKKGREAHVKATHFMEKASVQSAAKMESYFVEMAKRKINGIK